MELDRIGEGVAEMARLKAERRAKTRPTTAQADARLLADIAAVKPWTIRTIGEYSPGVPTLAIIDPKGAEVAYGTIDDFRSLAAAIRGLECKP